MNLYSGRWQVKEIKQKDKKKRLTALCGGGKGKGICVVETSERVLAAVGEYGSF